MPIESRILGFNRKEVVELLREYCSQTGRSLPANFVENLTMVRGRPVTVKVRLDPMDRSWSLGKRVGGRHHYVLHQARHSDGAARAQIPGNRA